MHLRLFCKSRLLPASAPAMIYVFVGIGVPLGAVVNGVFICFNFIFYLCVRGYLSAVGGGG